VSFSTFWHAKGGLQMCVFRLRYDFFGPSLWGGAIAPLAPRGSAAEQQRPSRHRCNVSVQANRRGLNCSGVFMCSALANLDYDFFIARQHAVHAQRDIVMTSPSVRPSVYCVCCV